MWIVAGKLPVVYVMFTVILLCVGLDVSQYRESGVSFSSKKTIIPLNLQMTLTKLWIKSDPQCHLADVPRGDVRQPLAVYDSPPSDQRHSCVVTPMPTRERSHCPVRTPVRRHSGRSKRAKIQRASSPGVQVCFNHRPGCFLARRGNHQRGLLPRNHAERRILDAGCALC